jgi:hypothetical protein
VSLESPQPRPPAPPPPEPRWPEPEGPAAHQKLLLEVRASQRRQHGSAALFYALAALMGTVCLSGVAGTASPVLGRAVWGVGLLGAAGLAFWVGVWRARAHVGDDVRTARWLGQRVPELSTDVLAAVELRRAMVTHPDFSMDLARAFLASTDAQAARVDPQRVLDHRGLRRAAGVFLGVAAASAGLVTLAFHAWQSGQAAIFQVTARATEGPPREPITGDVELTFHYPAYTGLSASTVSGTGGQVSAPRGTEVVIHTRADRDVARADLVVNGQAVPMQVEGGRSLSGRFVVDKSGAYHFTFSTSRGRPVAQGPDVPVLAVADAPPQVKLLTPAAELEVDPGQKVVLKFDASDDYGLTALALVFHPPRGAEARVELPHDEGRRSSGTYSWDLGTLTLEPGERVSYFIEAKDNDAVDGPQRGVSRTQTLKLYSASEHRREAVRKVELLWERLVTHLANRMEGPDRAEPPQPEKLPGQKTVDQQGVDLSSDMGAASEDILRERDAPKELAAALATISEAFGKRVRFTAETRRLLVQYQRTLNGMERRLAHVVEDEIREAERDVLYLETLVDRQKLQELKELAHQLDRKRRTLGELIDEYKKTQDPALKEDILKQVDALKKRINELMQRMSELSKSIHDEHLNQEALEEMMRQQNMGSALDEVERLLREGKTDEALAKLQQMATQLDEMVNRFDQANDQMSQDYPELAQKFQSFMNDLQDTSQQQRKLADQTKGIRDRFKDKAKERIKQKGQQLRADLLKEVEDVQQDYKQTGPDQMSSMRGDRDLERAEAELDNLRSALKAEDFDMAAESSERAERAAAELYQDADEQRARDEMWSNPQDVRQQSKRMAERMAKDAQKIADVRQKLDQLLPQPGQMMSEEDRQSLRQLAGEEKQLQRRAQGLQQQMEDISQLAPVFDPEAQQKMHQVGERMDDAARRMEGRDPSRGYGEQRAALEQLDQIQKAMRQSQGGGGGGGGLPLPMMFGSAGGRGGSGLGASSEKVEIPDADQYQAPKEFRKDLLDAMKQGAPDKYKDQVKRYYEELVK